MHGAGERGGAWKHRYVEDAKSSSAHFWRGDMVRYRNATPGGSGWEQPLIACPSRGMHQRKFLMPLLRTYHPSAALERVDPTTTAGAHNSARLSKGGGCLTGSRVCGGKRPRPALSPG